MNLKKMYQTTKAMMKLDASDEMKGLIKCPWSAVDICDYTKWIQRDYDGYIWPRNGYSVNGHTKVTEMSTFRYCSLLFACEQAVDM
jgi:hypothetical protein